MAVSFSAIGGDLIIAFVFHSSPLCVRIWPNKMMYVRNAGASSD
jgi:hypothetical protein